MTGSNRIRLQLALLLAYVTICHPRPQTAHGQEEVTIEDDVVIIHRSYGTDLPTFSPNGKTLAVCGNERLRFLSSATGQRLAQFPPSMDSPRRVLWMPDGRMVISVGDQIAFWNSQGKRLLELKPQEFATAGREYYFNRVAASPNGKSVAIGFQTGEIVVFPIADRTKFSRYKDGHAEYITQLIWKGETLYSSGGDGVVCVWNTATGALVRRIKANAREIRTMAVHPDGKSVATLAGDNEVVLWNASTGAQLAKCVPEADIESGHFKPGGIAFLAGGQIIASSYGNDIALWSAGGRLVRKLSGHDEYVRQIDASTDGKLMVSAGGASMRIWKTANVLRGIDLQSLPSSELPKVQPRSASKSVTLTRLDHWEIVRGDWKEQNGRIIGSGNSRINSKQTFPNELTFRCKLRVNGATNPRIRFDAFHFGYEGRQQKFFLHGPKATGEPFPFELGRVYLIEVQIDAAGTRATLRVDGQEIAVSHPKPNGTRTLSIEGGGKQSEGSCEFFDIEITRL